MRPAARVNACRSVKAGRDNRQGLIARVLKQRAQRCRGSPIDPDRYLHDLGAGPPQPAHGRVLPKTTAVLVIARPCALGVSRSSRVAGSERG